MTLGGAEPERVRIFTGEIEAFGGAERSLLALSRWLFEHNVTHEMVTYWDRVGLGKYASHPVPVVELRPGAGVLAKLRALRGYVAGVAGPRLMASGYQAALHASCVGVRGFHTLMHDTPALFSDAGMRGWKGRLRVGVSNRVIGLGVRSGGATIVTSEFLREECWKDFRVGAVIVRMGGLETIGFRERNVDGGLHLLSVSRVEANKRIDWILRSLGALEREDPALSERVDWRLRVVGKGSQTEAMRGLAAELGLGEKVSFCGFVSDAELARLYDEANLFVMPALQGFGIPAVEALQAGIPVLVHADSGVSDVLQNTPWATVAHGGAEEMTPALRVAIGKVAAGVHRGVALPKLETESSWAGKVAGCCGWAPSGDPTFE